MRYFVKSTATGLYWRFDPHTQVDEYTESRDHATGYHYPGYADGGASLLTAQTGITHTVEDSAQ